ncbi:MAG: hypothetical protein JKY19_14170 [Alcanivoracaceae bacterium]|nr:hypothetical protein [Alcanivoracaceae bacterium]
MSENHIKGPIEDLYKKSQDESSPLTLDNLILSQAKQSCTPQKKPQKFKRKSWLFGLSTAAVMVMSFSIIINLQNESKQITTQPEYMDIQQEEMNLEVMPESIPVDNFAQRPVNTAPAINKKINTQKKLKKETAKPDSSGLAGLLLTTKQKPEAAEKIVNFIEESTINMENKSLLSEQPVLLQTPSKAARKSIEQVEHNEDIIELDSITIADSVSLEAEDIYMDREKKIDKQIEKLEELMTQHKYEQAKILLKQLKSLYADYNFSKYEDIL